MIKNFTIQLTVIALTFVGVVHRAAAQCDAEGCLGEGGKLRNPLQFDSLGAFLIQAVEAFAAIGGVIGVFGMLYAGFLFVTAQGNETKLGTAKKAFLYSAIGLGIIIGAAVFAQAIEATILSIRAN